MNAPGHLRAVRSQSGFTLMEVLIAVAITSIILVPLLGWTMLSLRQQPIVGDNLVRTASTGLLGTYYPRDVSAAGEASKVGEDCAGGDGGNGSVRLVLLSGGTSATKIVYSEAPSSVSDPSDGSGTSLWRRECDAATGALRSSIEVFERIVLNSTVVTCSSEAGDAPCRQIDLLTMPAKANGADSAVRLRATRRVDANPASNVPELKVPPTAVITVASRSGTQPLTVDFTADDSVDPDGSIVNYRWEFSIDPGSDSAVTVREGPDQSHQQWIFPVAGEYTVWLTVTDDDGLSHTTHRRITTDNHAPIAIIDLGRNSGIAGVDEFSFVSERSYDPDGSIGSHRWVIDFAGTPSHPDGFQVALDGSSVGHVFPDDVSGIGLVTLTVTDLQGEVGTETAMITVNAPGTDPVDPLPVEGAPVPIIVVTTGDSPRELHFDGSQSTATGQIVSHLWQFAPGVQADAVSADFTYPAPGEYDVTLTVVDDQGRSGSKVQTVSVPGAPTKPGNPWRVGNDLVWNPVIGARRYLVDFEFASSTDCLLQLRDQAVGASPSPRKAIPVNPCPKGATTKARVGAEANGQVVYSDWVQVTSTPAGPPSTTPTTTTKPEIVK
ncbi:MAG: PKD domain-containing protein [Microthrixaceae bacterium]